MRFEYRKLGVCPSCGSPLAEYNYIVEGPESENVVVHASIRCPVCGYTEKKKIIFPIKALYAIRYLLQPNVRSDVEKLYLVSGARGGGLG